jgi:hypothetical protein
MIDRVPRGKGFGCIQTVDCVFSTAEFFERYISIGRATMSRTLVTIPTAVIMVTLAVACVAPLWGQAVANAQIQGLVTDPSGAVVPNARVTARQTNTGFVRTTVTGTGGTYVLPNLPVGPYNLEVQAGGFQAYVQTGIVLEVSNNVTINVVLRLGQVSQQVQVSANASMVQTQSTSISQVIEQRRIVDLPLNGRNATELVMLAGAANDVSNNSAEGSDLLTSKNYFTSDAISVAGGQSNGTNYLMDGGDNNDAFSNVNLPFPFPDAIEEFSVQTSTLSARYGVHPGAAVNIVTKSGTNQFHGDVFEFVRNGAFDARDFFAATQDTLRRNQFGGTIGGPIKKDKIFGFFGYQGTRIRTAPPSSISFVPTPAVLNGDFSQIESATCQASGVAGTLINPTTGQRFVNNFISPSSFNQPALNLLRYVPRSSNPCGEITYAIPEPADENQYIGRVDWNQSAKNSLFGRYFFAGYTSPASFNNDLLLTSYRGESERSQAVVVGDTYSFSPSALNSLHVTWTRLGITRGPTSNFINLTDLGVNIHSVVPNFLDLSVNGYFGGGCGTCAPAYFDENSGQIADDVDIMHGRHHISFGVDVIRQQENAESHNLANGVVTFNGQFTGDALADFMLGLPSDFEQGGAVPEDFRESYVGTYLEDNFRFTRRLNMQLGLRWEPYLPEHGIDNAGENWFFPTLFTAGKRSSVFVNAPPGMLYAGDPGMPHALSYDKLTDFEPRVGIAWDPTGGGRQTIRAGFGYFYDLPMMYYASDGANSPPWESSLDLPSPLGGFTNPYLGYPGGDPFPRPFPPLMNTSFVSEGAYNNYLTEPFPTYTGQWDLSYQRQLSKDWQISATYMGNKTTHGWTSTEDDPAVYIPGTCYGAPCSTTSNTNQRRVLYLENPVTGSLVSNLYTMDPGSNGEYEALLLSAQHRFGNHYTILGNYTYSHCIDEGDFLGDMGGPEYQDPHNRNADRGNCGFDLRQIFNLSFVATTPRFTNWWASRLLGNWQLAPIVSIHSGPWFPALTGTDNSLTGIGLDRPNVVGNPYIRSTTGNLQWLNPTAFAPNALGAFGNAGNMALEGHGYFDVDTDVSRYFTVRENQRLEVRFEFFNLGNNVNFSIPDNTLTDPTFGRILSDVSPRILQFALRYTF